MTDLIQNLWQIVVIIGGIAGGAVWLRSQLTKQRSVELEKLAETRGERNRDLEQEIQGLRQEIAELRGELQFMKEMKHNQIAEATAAKVVEELLPFLRST